MEVKMKQNFKNIINQELNEMKTDKVYGKQTLQKWQTTLLNDTNSMHFETDKKRQRKFTSTILRYGTYVAVACLIMVIGFTSISVASGKVGWNMWMNQLFSGKVGDTDSQEAKVIEKHKEEMLNQNKSIALGKYRIQVLEYTMDNNGFFYLLISLKDDTGENVMLENDQLTLNWKDENKYHSIDNLSVSLTRDKKDMKEITKPYGYSISGICPALIDPKNTLVVEVEGAHAEINAITVTESGNYKYSDKKSSVSFSPYGFLMKKESLLSGRMNKALSHQDETIPTFIATYSDGTKDKLQVSNYGGMNDSSKYDTYLQFSPIFQYQKHTNQQTVWDEENYNSLMHSLTNYKFDVNQLINITLEDGTVIFEKGKM